MKKLNIQGLVLGVVSTAGIIGLGLVAPGALKLIGSIRDLEHVRHKARYRYSVNLAIRQLQKKGLLTVQRNASQLCQLTERGKLELERYRAREKVITKNSWDKQWRVVVFDVLERRRGARDLFRIILKELGFERLQQSVWISPYECEAVIQLAKAECRLGNAVLSMTVSHIENENRLKKLFPGLLP